MRTETTTRELYKFDELSDAAKARARDWWRECGLHDEWFEFVYDDAERVAALLGIDINQRQIESVNGSTRPEPRIWFSGFACQGDGACFDGDYAYKIGSVHDVRKYAPHDTDLHLIALQLQKLQKRFFYQLEAACTHSGRYYHSGCMSVCVGRNRDGWEDVDADTEEALTDILRDFANWIYRQLEAEYDYQMSDDAVDETILCNEYEFDAEGNRA